MRVVTQQDPTRKVEKNRFARTFVFDADDDQHKYTQAKQRWLLKEKQEADEIAEQKGTRGMMVE